MYSWSETLVKLSPAPLCPQRPPYGVVLARAPAAGAPRPPGNQGSVHGELHLDHEQTPESVTDRVAYRESAT
jgi:hypothetical protein